MTFYVDRYDTDDPLHRVLILSAMLATIFLSANIHSTFEDGGVGFVWAYVAIKSIVLLLYYRASRYVPVARSNVKLYLISYLPSTLLWLASLLLPAPTRYWLWGIAIAIELLVPIWGSRILAGTPAHPSHLQERYGLFTLIVLGEAIVSVATTVNESWQPLPIFVAVCGFGVAACLWWLYFNFLETAAIVRGIGSVHIFNYGHLPIVMGLVLVAVGTERTIVETAQASVLSAGARWALLGGVALYTSAIALMTVFACRRRFSWAIVGSILAVLGLAIFGEMLSPPVVIGLLSILLSAKVSYQIFTNRARQQVEPIETIEFGD